jgi:hypothetical protein
MGLFRDQSERANESLIIGESKNMMQDRSKQPVFITPFPHEEAIITIGEF